MQASNIGGKKPRFPRKPPDRSRRKTVRSEKDYIKSVFYFIMPLNCITFACWINTYFK